MILFLFIVFYYFLSYCDIDFSVIYHGVQHFGNLELLKSYPINKWDCIGFQLKKKHKACLMMPVNSHLYVLCSVIVDSHACPEDEMLMLPQQEIF